MTKIVITTKNGETVEISDIQLGVKEIKELAGLNGNGSHTSVSRRVRSISSSTPELPNYKAFRESLSERGRKFIDVLRMHPSGILADELAEKLGLHNGVQIGGVTGGGLAKLAPRFHVDLGSIYTVEKKFENGMRRTIYRPGRNIEKV